MYWEKEVRTQKDLPAERYFRGTGVFGAKFESGVEVAGVSANSWEEYWEYMRRLASHADKYIVSPELVTSAGMNIVDEVLRISSKTSLVGKNVYILPEGVKSLLLVACWGCW